MNHSHGLGLKVLRPPVKPCVSRENRNLISEFSTSRIHHLGHLVQIHVVAIGLVWDPEILAAPDPDLHSSLFGDTLPDFLSHARENLDRPPK